MSTKGDGRASDWVSGLTIRWWVLTAIFGVIGVGSLITLGVIVHVKSVDTLSTVALGLAVISFAAQLIVTMAQAQQSAQVNRETMSALSEMRTSTASLLTNQREQYDKLLEAALQLAIPAAVKDVSEGEADGGGEPIRDTEERTAELLKAVEMRLAESLAQLRPQTIAEAASHYLPKPTHSPTREREIGGLKRRELDDWQELLTTYPSREEGQPVAETVRQLPAKAIARLADIASDTARSTYRDHRVIYRRTAADEWLANRQLIDAGLLESIHRDAEIDRLTFRLTPNGVIAARILRGRGEPPEWAADLR